MRDRPSGSKKLIHNQNRKSKFRIRLFLSSRSGTNPLPRSPTSDEPANLRRELPRKGIIMTTLKKRRFRAIRNSPLNSEEKSTRPFISFSRRSFLLKGFAVGAGAAAGGLLVNNAYAAGGLTPGDAALLRFPAALEILEADFWIQYNELGGVQDAEVPGGSGIAAYTNALAVLDSDMAVYIHDNTDDEITH